MIHLLQQQAYDDSWVTRELFEDKALAEKELALLNDLLINGKPISTYRVISQA
jgi:hypothetical protein